MQALGLSLSDFLDLVRTVFIALSAITVSIAALSYRASSRSAASNLFLSLRNNYMDVIKTLMNELPDLSDVENKLIYSEATKNQKHALHRYWVNSFSEWYATTVIYKNDHTKLWKNFYRKAQAGSLTNPLLRDALADILTNHSYFGDRQDAYRSEIISIVDDIMRGDLQFPARDGAVESLYEFKERILKNN